MEEIFKWFHKALSVLGLLFIELLGGLLSCSFGAGKCPARLSNKEWRLIKSDVDPNPSFPHVHDVKDHRYKMDIYTGVIYKENKRYDCITERELKKLWSDPKFVADIKEVRKTYIHGEEKLPEIPVFAVEDESIV